MLNLSEGLAGIRGDNVTTGIPSGYREVLLAEAPMRAWQRGQDCGGREGRCLIFPLHDGHEVIA